MSNPSDTNTGPGHPSGDFANPAPGPLGDEKRVETEHVESSWHPFENGTTGDKHKDASIAVIKQQHTIPTTGKRMLTTKWEYIFFCVFCKCYDL